MHEVLERRFAAIGARLSIAKSPFYGSPRIDVLHDRRGERFDISFAPGANETEIEAIDVRPRDRHLLLLVRNAGAKSKYLVGHDERHWFVAAVPEAARGVSGVATAKLALQPNLVRDVVERVHPKNPHRRRNDAYVRQGEWFFVPAPHLVAPPAEVVRDEPLSRGRGRAHVMQFAWRTGGTMVYVNHAHPSGISEARIRRLPPKEQRVGGWVPFTRDPEVYATGTVRHPDHATIELQDWHRVLMDTENEAEAMRHVVFLD